MPTYKYECDNCGHGMIEVMSIADHDTFNAKVPLHALDSKFGLTHCGYYKQVYDFHIALGQREHYSHQLQSVVTSDQDFKRKLRQQEIDMSQRMGFDVHYDTIDPSDAVAAGVKGDDGFESQERAYRDANSDGHRTVFS